MGVIEGGSVSGMLPARRVFAVNYPAYPSSLARATETLGGEETIAKARSSDANYLELKFRPEDPYAHAAFGELHQTSELLLCIKRKRRKQSLEHSQSGVPPARSSLEDVDDANRPAEMTGASFEVSADIVARVEHSYNFDGMADYQYVLPVHADAAKSNRKRRREEQRFEKGGLMDMEQEELMMLVPPLFSLKDIPEETVLRPSDFTNKKTDKKNTGDTTVEMESDRLSASGLQGLAVGQPIMSCKASQVDVAICMQVHGIMENVPTPLQWEDKLVPVSVEYKLTAAVVHLFEERPIWAKATLTDRLVDQGAILTTFQIKRLLFRTAYNFGYGPFRTLWIKNGYDPRKDPKSCMYQMMDFRIPRAVRESGHAPERSMFDDRRPAWRDICAFRVAPQKKFSFLQLYDLEDDFVQEQIRKPAERSSCSVAFQEYTGWYRRATVERLRQHIRVRFLGLMPGEVARELQRVEAKSLQRYLSTANKTVRWKDDPPDTSNADNLPEHTGPSFQTPLELSFTPLPENLSQEERDVGSAKAHNIPVEDEEEDPITGGDAHKHEEEEEEEPEDEEDDEEEEDEDEEEEEEEEDEDEEEEHEDDLLHQPEEAGPGSLGAFIDPTDKMPDGFLQELLRKFPFSSSHTPGFGQAQGSEGGEEDAEYAIYEQDDDDEDDD